MSNAIESTNLEPNEGNNLERERLDNEISRLELERYKVERELKLDHRRYALEKYRTKHERQLLDKNLGVLISAAISLAAVLVSVGQVWVAKISKDKELAVASFQSRAENERLDKQKDKELALQFAEQERQWNLSRAKFIAENKSALFDGSTQEQKRMSVIIETLFPADIAANMFEDLKRTAESPESKNVWSDAQKRLQPGSIQLSIVDENGLAIKNVEFKLMSENRTIMRRRFSSGPLMIEVSEGSFKLRVDAEGYAPTEKDVTVSKDTVSTINVTLRKSEQITNDDAR